MGARVLPEVLHTAITDSTFYVPESLGSGVGWVDFDSDGRIDIVVVDGAGRPPRLYQNHGGRFESAPQDARLQGPAYGMGVAAGDYDNDGRVDLFLTGIGSDRLYRATDGGFEDVSAAAGLDAPADWSTSAAWLDYDRDGWLDLFVVNYLELDDSTACSDRAGAPEYCGPRAYPGVPDRLWRNLGDGTFVDVSESAGIGGAAGRGLGVVAGDFDRDGSTEIYVANDGEENFLWHMGADGRFRDVSLPSGAAVNGQGVAEAGMGVAAADVDGDGWADLFLTHLGGESHTLYLSHGDGTFVDESDRRGLVAASLPWTGFGTAAIDVDNDMDLDLVVANGRINRDVPVPGAQPGFFNAYAEPNTLFINEGGGYFEEAGDRSGALADAPGVSRGLAAGDFDDDGGVDLLVLEAGREVRLLRNVAPRGNWAGYHVIDPSLGGRTAVGAELSIFVGPEVLRRAVNPSYGYLSTHDPRVHVGLGDAPRPDSVRVAWLDGTVESFNPGPGGTYETLRRGEGR